MKPKSAKAKGRCFQQEVIATLIAELAIYPEDIESRSMGAGGEDIIMSKAAREAFPFSVECKRVERLNVPDAYKQAKSNAKSYEPVVIHRRKREKALVTLSFDAFVDLVRKATKHEEGV